MRLPFLSALLVVCFQMFAPASEVSDFGAIGDGVADDTDAVQAAVDAGWGSVRFEKGIYRLTKTIVVNLDNEGPLSLVGDGTARIVMAGAGPAFRIVGTHGGTADPASVKHEVLDHQLMPLVDGIEIVGAHAEADGIEATGTMQLTITRVNIRDCRRFLITGCSILDSDGVGVLLENVSQSRVAACLIADDRRKDGFRAVEVRGGEGNVTDAR